MSVCPSRRTPSTIRAAQPTNAHPPSLPCSQADASVEDSEWSPVGGPFSTLFPVTNSFASGPDIVTADASRIVARFVSTDTGYVWMGVAPEAVVAQLTIGDIKSGNPSLLAPCTAIATPVVRRTSTTVSLDGCLLGLNTSYVLVAYLDTELNTLGGQVQSAALRTATNTFAVDPAAAPRAGELSLSYDGFQVSLTPAVAGRLWLVVANAATDARTAVDGASPLVQRRAPTCTVTALALVGGTVNTVTLRACNLTAGATYVVTVYIDDASVSSAACARMLPPRAFVAPDAHSLPTRRRLRSPAPSAG